MMHEMKLKLEEFDHIKYNNKVMEVRLNDKKRKEIKLGDRIIFYKLPELSECIIVNVEEIYTFRTFRQLYNKFPSSYFGYDELNVNEILDKIYSIYSSNREEEYGVIAIKFKTRDAETLFK